MKDFLAVLADLLGYLKESKKIYISLFLAFLLLIGTLILLTEGTAVMPFIYTLF
jgi:hypothetical protein